MRSPWLRRFANSNLQKKNKVTQNEETSEGRLLSALLKKIWKICSAFRVPDSDSIQPAFLQLERSPKDYTHTNHGIGNQIVFQHHGWYKRIWWYEKVVKHADDKSIPETNSSHLKIDASVGRLISFFGDTVTARTRLFVSGMAIAIWFHLAIFFYSPNSYIFPNPT